MKRVCLSCPAPVLMNREYCWRCKQRRERQQAAAQRRKAGMTPRRADYSPDVIELRFIRALWAKNPRMAQAALARMGRAA